MTDLLLNSRKHGIDALRQAGRELSCNTVKILLLLLLACRADGRASLAAWSAYGSCLASAADFGATAAGAARGGVHENNPLFRSSTGQPVMWRVGAIKGGTCVAMIYLAHRKGRASDISIMMSIPSSAMFTRATIHDIHQLRK